MKIKTYTTGTQNQIANLMKDAFRNNPRLFYSDDPCDPVCSTKLGEYIMDNYMSIDPQEGTELYDALWDAAVCVSEQMAMEM